MRRRELLMTGVIPIIFAIGMALFFILLPPQSITLMNFIAYVSSLSTVIMVLIYIFTTSRQLNAMHNQLKEMQFSRNLQNQPLPFLTHPEAEIEKPDFYSEPKNAHTKLSLSYAILFNAKIENMGNTPAVAVNILPRIVCVEHGMVPDFESICRFIQKEPKKLKIIETLTTQVACLSLKEEGSENVECFFPDTKHTLIRSVLSTKLTFEFLDLTILYKNVLGANFKAKMLYIIGYSDKDLDKFQSYLKAIETAKIDCATELEEYTKLRKRKDFEKAQKTSDKIHRKFRKMHKLKNVPLKLKLVPDAFSVSPITEEEYTKELLRVKEFMRKEFPPTQKPSTELEAK